MTANPRLSLCMIVRDEEKWIAACLNSVRDVVDEMIVVDTGSVDSTPALAAECGAKLFHYAWNGHFAEARNYSIEQASGDWILWMDADERLDETHRHAIRDILHSDKWMASLPVLNYYGEEPADPARTNRLLQLRLFRNSPKLRFRHAIHEQLVRIPEITENTVAHLPAIIHHYGYMDAPVREKQKSQRNLQLLKAAIQREQDYDPWLDYHMASEWYRLGEAGKALASLHRSMLRFLQKRMLPPSLFYRLKYTILIEAGFYKEGAKGIDAALQIYPDYVDLHLFKGIMLLQLNEPEEALKVFHHCLSLGDGNLVHLTSNGAGSFHAWYYIGRCHQLLGQTEKAREAFEKALLLFPNYKEALEQLKRMEVESHGAAVDTRHYSIDFPIERRQCQPDTGLHCDARNGHQPYYRGGSQEGTICAGDSSRRSASASEF